MQLLTSFLVGVIAAAASVAGQNISPCIETCLTKSCQYQVITDLQCICSNSETIRTCIRNFCSRTTTPSEVHALFNQFCGTYPTKILADYQAKTQFLPLTLSKLLSRL